MQRLKCRVLRWLDDCLRLYGIRAPVIGLGIQLSLCHKEPARSKQRHVRPLDAHCPSCFFMAYESGEYWSDERRGPLDPSSFCCAGETVDTRLALSRSYISEQCLQCSQCSSELNSPARTLPNLANCLQWNALKWLYKMCKNKPKSYNCTFQYYGMDVHSAVWESIKIPGWTVV